MAEPRLLVDGKIDDAGVIRLSTRDFDWPVLSQAAEARVAAAKSADEIVDLMLDESNGWDDGLIARVLHPAQGAVALLCPPVPGQAALDLGTGWTALSSALRSLGTRVTSADWSYTRLRFSQLMHEGASDTAAHIDPAAPLPWADASFDVVLLDLDEVSRTGTDADVLLAEVRRVLADAGTAVVACRHSPGRRARRMRAILRKTGLLVSRVVVPFPGHAAPHHLVPETELRRHIGEIVHRGAGWKDAAKYAVKHALRLVGFAHWIPHDRLMVARRDRGIVDVGTWAGTFAGDLEDLPTFTTLSDARVALQARSEFIKVPLSLHQQLALADESEKTRSARRTPFAPFTLAEGERRQAGGVPYVSYPLIEERPGTAGETAEVVLGALRAVAPGELAPLRSTTFWARLSGRRGESDVRETGAKALREATLDELGDLLVPCGPTHGDLHEGNVLLPVSGPPGLVDWNRFEVNNPLVLDAGYAAIRAHELDAGAGFASGLLAFSRGELESELAAHAMTLLGSLELRRAAELILLDRIVSYSLPRRRYKPWTMRAMVVAVHEMLRT